MSGFEDYSQEIADIDRQIARYVAICELPFREPLARKDIERLLDTHPAYGNRKQAQETLRALLILRIRLETEMIEQGFTPPDLRILPHDSAG